ncbi:MAG: hypothetical protein IJ324_03735 [Lachnospiraceae bacterium]|nr:hypothetical protein [Lachnospiraceae bacterium]
MHYFIFWTAQIGIMLLPIVFVVFLVNSYKILENAFKERRTIRETRIYFKSVFDFFPSNVEKVLTSNKKNCKDDIATFMKNYYKVFRRIIVYYGFWITYIVMIVMRIHHLCSGFYIKMGLSDNGSVIAFIIASILEVYWFLLSPIFEFYGKSQLVALGYWVYKSIEKISLIGSKFIARFFGVVISYIILYWFIGVFEKRIYVHISQYGVCSYIAFLMIYQYGFLNVIASIVSKIPFLKRKDISLFVGLDRKVIYSSLKNCTYLAMIFINSLLENSDDIIVISIGFLFLFDDYLVKDKEIVKCIENNKKEGVIKEQDY